MAQKWQKPNTDNDMVGTLKELQGAAAEAIRELKEKRKGLVEQLKEDDGEMGTKNTS